MLLLLLLAAFFISDAWSVGANLYPLRLVLPFAFVFGVAYLLQLVVKEKAKRDVSPTLFYALLFTLYMFLHTALVSWYRTEFLGDDYEFNALMNYLFLFVLMLTLFTYALIDRLRFLSYSKIVIAVFYVLYFFYAFYEIRTGNHLAVSSLYDAPNWLRFSPTTVYFNSNDFATIFTLMFMYLFSTAKGKGGEGLKWYVYLLMILQLFVLYKTQSRLSMLLFVVYMGYKAPRFLMKGVVLAIVAFLFVGLFVERSFFMQSLDALSKLQEDMTFSERNSTGVRVHLYKHALLSVKESWGLGLGVDASGKYLQSVADPNLHYITNPHAYVFELLINSGLLSTFAYLLLNAYLLVKSWLQKNHDLMVQLIIYNLLLFSSSSSLFLWPIHLFFVLYVFETISAEPGRYKVEIKQ